jgi:glyoxylase-like metal-dependent hydrolase (beta-lactamase superfamily II)
MKTSNKTNRFLLAAIAGTLGLTALQSPVATAASGVSKAKAAIYEWESPAEGFNTKTYFYDTGKEVVAFDAQFTPQAATAAIAFLRTKTTNPIRYVVVTHPNPDKFNGTGVFRSEGATVVSSKATADAIAGVHAYKKYFFVNIAKSFTETTYPAQATIDQTFTGTMSLKLKGNTKVQLTELVSPGVSSTQTVAILPNLKSIVVGDLVHNNAHAWLEGGIVNGAPKPTIDGWINDLTQVSKLAPASWTVLGGRGTNATVSVAIPKQISYLKAADQLVTETVRGLGDRRAATIKNPGLISDELTASFKEKYPAYKLDYMITYGIYGLVAQKLAS